MHMYTMPLEAKANRQMCTTANGTNPHLTATRGSHKSECLTNSHFEVNVVVDSIIRPGRVVEGNIVDVQSALRVLWFGSLF